MMKNNDLRPNTTQTGSLNVKPRNVYVGACGQPPGWRESCPAEEQPYGREPKPPGSCINHKNRLAVQRYQRRNEGDARWMQQLEDHNHRQSVMTNPWEDLKRKKPTMHTEDIEDEDIEETTTVEVLEISLIVNHETITKIYNLEDNPSNPPTPKKKLEESEFEKTKREFVDKAKIDVIAKLPPSTNVKAVRSWKCRILSPIHKRFFQNLSSNDKTSQKDSVFDFNKECIEAFKTLKEKLTNAPIMVSLYWSQPFKLMCDVSDFVVGAVIGQWEGKHFRPIRFPIKTQNNPQQNYTITEKELIAVVFANVAAYHLSRLENLNLEELREEDINDNFFDETFMNVSSNDEDEIPCFIINGHRVKLYRDEEQLNELSSEEIHFMCEEGKMKAILYMAPFPADYRKTMPWAAEKPFIYIIVENTRNEAMLYDLDETGKGIVKGNFLYVKKEPSEEYPLKKIKQEEYESS
nr:reverse transcriptase domain-containing protein [Tanacetum cinerariifolium]